MEALIIRSAHLSDMVQIEEIYKEELKDAREKGQPSALGTPYYQADRDFIERHLAGENRYQVLVAEINDQVIGYARALHLLNRRPPQKNTDLAERQTTIHKLGCLKQYRGQGVGTALLQAIAHQALILDRSVLRISLPQGNPFRFYQKCGFKLVGVLPAKSGKRPISLIEATPKDIQMSCHAPKKGFSQLKLKPE